MVNIYRPPRARLIPVYKERDLRRGLLFKLDPERGIIEIEVKGVLHVVDLAAEIVNWERKQALAQEAAEKSGK